METKNTIFINNIHSGKSELIRSISSYASSGIDIEITSLDNNVATVIIRQSKLINGFILNQKQLVERCKEAFKNTGIKTIVVPVVFSLDVNTIDILWIENKMSEFGIKRNDLVKQLAIDKSSLSLVLSGKRELSKPMRATFFYYFLTYELNKDFREND
jgi:hypothetical protein